MFSQLQTKCDKLPCLDHLVFFSQRMHILDCRRFLFSLTLFFCLLPAQSKMYVYVNEEEEVRKDKKEERDQIRLQ